LVQATMMTENAADLEDEWHRVGLNRPATRRITQSKAWTNPEDAEDRMWG
jgi:hypothetical protein